MEMKVLGDEQHEQGRLKLKKKPKKGTQLSTTIT